MEQTTDARSEINRLNKIIDILADQIGILKAENTLYKKYIAGITAGNAIAFSDNGNPEAGTSIAEKGNAPPNDGTSIVEKGNASHYIRTSNDFFGNGNSEAGTSIVEKVNASPTVRTSIVEKVNTSPTAGTSIVEKGNASPDFEISIVEKGNALPDLGTSIVEKVNTLSDIGNPLAGKVNSASISGKPNAGKAPDYIDTGYTNKKKLERAIKHFFPLRTKGSKISSFASQMLLLYNKHQASYPEMRKVSGMSQGGFNKQAPDLRKKGFVVRTSHQKYALTQMSKQIIDKVFGV